MGKIMVTGGAGMIGSNLVRKLSGLGHEVVVVDNLWRGKLDYLKRDDGVPCIEFGRAFHRIDLRIPRVIDKLLVGVDYVFHLADVVAGIGYVFGHQGSLFRDNVLINSNVIDSVRRSHVKGIIYVGTACSFPAQMQSGIDAPPLKETDQYPAHPESAYGWSKLMGEYETFMMGEETGIKTSVLILHNVYGAPADFSPETGQVIPSLIRKAINWPQETFDVWGSGGQGRAFVHVDDVTAALCLAMERGWGKGPIQIGPDVCTSIREIAETVVSISGKNIDIRYDLSKPEGDRGRCANYTKARTVLGWVPQINLREGLSGLYRWVEGRMSRLPPGRRPAVERSPQRIRKGAPAGGGGYL